MKKRLIPIIVIVILSLALVGLAYAQTPDQPQNEYPDGFYRGGMMGRWSGGVGMWGRGWRANGSGGTQDYGPMHDQMISAFAQAFDISVQELEERHDAGETMWSIAEGLGLSYEQFRDVMIEARNQALSQAVADGILSQEHYQWMRSRMNQMWSGEYQPGYGGCYGDTQPGFGRYGGWMNR